VEGAPPEERQFDSITLLVSPRQAARLMVGQRLGSFRVVLRGKLDREALTLAPLRGAHLMPAERSRDNGIEFIVGGARASGGMLAPVALPTSLGPLPALPTGLLPPGIFPSSLSQMPSLPSSPLPPSPLPQAQPAFTAPTMQSAPQQSAPASPPQPIPALRDTQPGRP